ncbi:hypothetical protein [Streptomyces sp. NPDC056683]|uniref:hypothetical protein n=1 Tax=Streptomyces sp. NPDC056683 TaxID=3345910 RepID=UPI0036767B84
MECAYAYTSGRETGRFGRPSPGRDGGRGTDLAYDGLGRLVQVWLQDRPKAKDFTPSIKYEYLIRGADGPAAVHTQKIENDGTSYGSEWSLYDGWLRPRQDQTEGGVRTTVVKDARDNTTTRIQYPVDGDAVTTSYGYDDAGRLTGVTDDKGNDRTYTYDQLGGKKTAVDPDTGSSSYTYDALDRQTSVTVNGDKTSTVYDEPGRPVSTWQGEATTGTKLSVTKYDTVHKGELYGVCTYKDGAVYSSVTYPTLDPDNDYAPVSTKYYLSKTAEPQLGGTYEFTAQYNDDGTPQSQGLPATGDLSAEAVGYVYDGLRRPTGLTTSLGGLSYVTDVSYSPTSNLEQLELYRGEATAKKTWITHNYEAGTDRLTNSRVDVQGASSVAYDADYTYDKAGDILSVADTPTGGTSDVQCFSYDGLGRVSSAWTSSVESNGAKGTGSTDASCASGASTSTVGGVSPYWTDYGYDTIGNRTSEVRHGLNGAATSSRTYKYGETGSGPNGAASGAHTVSSVTEKTGATSTTPAVTSQNSYTYDASGNTKTRVLDGDTQSLAGTSRAS